VTGERPGRSANCTWTSDGRHLVFRADPETGTPQVVLSDLGGRAWVDLSRTPFPSYPQFEIPTRALEG
jgi:hypothetical protein